MHKLKHIAQMETKITKDIIDYKMEIIDFLKQEEVKSLVNIMINRRNGYVKIETRSPLLKNRVSDLEDNFDMSIDHQSSICIDTNGMYNYIFKPN